MKRMDGADASAIDAGSGMQQEDTPCIKVQRIDAARGKEMLAGGDVTLVDVRTAEEYAAGYIAGALLLPNETIWAEPPAQLPDRAAKIVVYCRSGRRSAEAAQKLVQLGYQNVFDMGGIQDWPYEIVSGETTE